MTIIRGSLDTFFSTNVPRASRALIDLASVVKVEIDVAPIEQAKREIAARRRNVAAQLDVLHQRGPAESIVETDQRIADLETALDEPARKYAESQRALQAWSDAMRQTLEGGDGQDGVADVEAAIAECEQAPQRLAELEASRKDRVAAIHRALLAKIDVLNDLYAPARAFIDRHELAVKSGLEFAAALGQNGLQDRFWQIVGRNVAGHFFGQIEGTEALQKMIDSAVFDETASVCDLTTELCRAVSEKPGSSDLDPERCLRKGRTLEELFDLIFSLTYIEPFHFLRYRGVPLERLSPGEKGTLLLMFYLLIDPSRKPLLLDQPDENLDNETVKELLAPAIKEASARRQVVIVTHNPNVAVVADADQVIVAAQDGDNFRYRSRVYRVWHDESVRRRRS